MGAISRFMCPKTKLFNMIIKCITELFRLQDLRKKFWAQFHDLCAQKRSCFLWNSDAFQKFSTCKICKKCFGRIFTICVSRKQTFLTSTCCKNDLSTFYFKRVNIFCEYWPKVSCLAKLSWVVHIQDFVLTSACILSVMHLWQTVKLVFCPAYHNCYQVPVSAHIWSRGW